jgi:hypothetical protein
MLLGYVLIATLITVWAFSDTRPRIKRFRNGKRIVVWK